MNPLPKWIVWWTIIALLLFGCWLMCEAGPSQGDGAFALIKKRKPSVAIPPTPKFVVIPPKIKYFAVTATNDWGESDFSNEASSTNGYPTLAWDPTTNTVGYRVYRGRVSRVYTNSWSAGTNTTFSVPKPPVLTNCVVSVTTTNATNLFYSFSLKGPWTSLGRTNYTATNDPPKFWKAFGRTKARPGQVFVAPLVWQ